MNVRFTSLSRRQIAQALDQVAAASPQGAARIRDRIVEAASLLQRYPFAGQATSRRGIRRVVLNPHPYLIFYRVDPDEIVILRFRHGARRDVERS